MEFHQVEPLNKTQAKQLQCLREFIKSQKNVCVAYSGGVDSSLVAAIAASFIIDKNFFSLLLAYCPGGIYEVAVIAIAFDLDPEFVAFHHIIRLLMILFSQE